MRIDSLPKQRHSLIPPPLLKPQKPKEAKQIRVVGRGGQQLQICGFSIVEPAGAVEFKRLPEVSASCHFHGTSHRLAPGTDVRMTELDPIRKRPLRLPGAAFSFLTSHPRLTPRWAGFPAGLA